MKSITLYTKPVPVNQKYGVVNGRMLLQKKYRDAKNDIALEIRSQWPEMPRTDDLCMNVMIYLGTKRKIDIDAYLKILLDAAEGVVFDNDNQVTELHVFREYDKQNPRVEIQIL